METSELLKKVRKIEIKTRGLSKQVFAGQYHSAFKGRGMTFSEVREYQYGDDIRNIDWNVTARFSHPYVKLFEEERELTVMLLVDVSGSRNFGTQSRMKKDMITEIAAVLSFSAIENNDKIGIMFFSNKVEKFILPQKGRKHILHIIRELLDYEPVSTGTNFTEPLRYITNAIKKRCIAFVISDFIGNGFEEALRIANSKHDIVALQVYDIRETEMPDIGLVRFRDAETGEVKWIDTTGKKIRGQYNEWWTMQQKNALDIFRKSGVDHVSIRTDMDYVQPLIRLFKRRERRA